VLLHEGLGCVSLWRDFPARLAEATGLRTLAFSRAGYGASDPEPLPWPVTFMHRQALEVLGPVLDAAGIDDAVLVGHSDGASIALVHAGGADPTGRVRGLALLAPHVFCEDLTIRSIEAARDAYEHGDLRERLARHHGASVDNAFRGWNGAWLDPGFRAWSIEEYLPRVRVPVLVIQGEDDEYGTRRQLDAIAAACPGPVETLLLPGCGHSPHRDRPQETLRAIAAFVRRLVPERARS
jgi:pimeloyl-ACP methyl ester carboxylesterase